MRAEEIRGLMEAYSKVNATPEVLSEGVVELSDEDLEGIELIEMTMEEIEQLDEQGGAGGAAALTAKRQRVAAQGQVKTALGQGKGIGLQSASGLGQGTKPGQKAFGTQLGGRQGVVVKGGASGPNYGPRGGSSFTRAANTVNVGGQTLYKAKKGKDIVYLQGKDKPQLFKPGQSGSTTPTKPAETSAPKPAAAVAAPKPAAAAAAPKPAAAAAAPKPTTPAAPAKPAPGTKAAGPESIKPKTPNPLMQKTFGYQTGNAPDQIAKASAGKPTPSGSALGSAADPKVRAALNLPSKPVASLSQAPAPKPAEAPKPQMSARAQALKAGGPAGGARERMLNQDLDLFDIIKGHLLDEGYAETEEGAMVIMVNMSEEWRKSILESYGVELDENREHEREMRKAAARERAEEKKERKEEGKKSAKAPGRLGKSAGSSYADYQELSIKSHDKMTKGKYIPGMVKNEEVELVDEGLTGDRYKAALKKGKMYSRKVSADPEKRATRGGRGGESDFGAGDRGSGNKAARRAGTYQEEYVDEAQHARENPEKYEREQEKKSAPVRGEKTPMPPRGDKRREEFEKWYAKQMGR